MYILYSLTLYIPHGYFFIFQVYVFVMSLNDGLALKKHFMMVIYCKYDRYAVRKSLVEWIYYMKRIILKCIMSRWGKSMEVNLLTSIRSNEYQLTMYFCVYMTLCVKRWRFFPGSAFITFTQLCAHAPLSGFLSQCDLCLIFRLNWQSIMFTNAVNLLRRVKAIYVVWENKKHFNRG